jgi:insecticidal toxin complex protein TccC
MNPGVHRHTPKIVALDSRGLPIRQMTYLRRESTASPIACIARQQNNPQGQLSAVFTRRRT